MEKEQTLKKSLTKTEQKLLDELLILSEPEMATNPYSGVQVILEPKGVALYDYIKGYEKLLNQGKITNIRQFDTARYLFQKLYPESYMKLLD